MLVSSPLTTHPYPLTRPIPMPSKKISLCFELFSFLSVCSSVHRHVLHRPIDRITNYIRYLAMRPMPEWDFRFDFQLIFLLLLLSKNSLICKAALHDGRLAPWNSDNTTIFIRNNSLQLTSFLSSLRNGILSNKLLDSPYFAYQFVSSRING